MHPDNIKIFDNLSDLTSYCTNNFSSGMLNYIMDGLTPGKIEYNTYCQKYPEKTQEFENLLRIYQGDYIQTLKVIKKEIK